MTSNNVYTTTDGRIKLIINPQDLTQVTVYQGGRIGTFSITEVLEQLPDEEKPGFVNVAKKFMQSHPAGARTEALMPYLDDQRSGLYTWQSSDTKTTYAYDPISRTYSKLVVGPAGSQWQPVKFSKPTWHGYIPLTEDLAYVNMATDKKRYDGRDGTWYDDKEEARKAAKEAAAINYANSHPDIPAAAKTATPTTTTTATTTDTTTTTTAKPATPATTPAPAKATEPPYKYAWTGNRFGEAAGEQQQEMVNWYNDREGYDLNKDFTRYGDNGVDRKWGRASDAQYKKWQEDQAKWENNQNALTNSQLLDWEGKEPLTEANQARRQALVNYYMNRADALNFQGTPYANEARYNAAVEAANAANAQLNADNQQKWDDKMKTYAGYLDQDRKIPKNRLAAIDNINTIYEKTKGDFTFDRKVNPTSTVAKSFGLTNSQYRQARRQYNRGARRGAYAKGAFAQDFYSKPEELQTNFGLYSGPAALTEEQLGATTFEPQSQKQGGKLSYINYIYK